MTGIPTLVESDLTHGNPRLRAGQLFKAWRERVDMLAAANARDPHGNDFGGWLSSAERGEEHHREYLIEFVEVHQLNYSKWDPRNDIPGVAEAEPGSEPTA